MGEPNLFDTETRLFCTVEQAELLIKKLQTAIEDGRRGSMAYARQDCNQFSKNGPWRLVIAVKGDEE